MSNIVNIVDVVKKYAATLTALGYIAPKDSRALYAYLFLNEVNARASTLGLDTETRTKMNNLLKCLKKTTCIIKKAPYFDSLNITSAYLHSLASNTYYSPTDDSVVIVSTAGNGKLTITQDGTEMGTFYANQDSDTTIDVTGSSIIPMTITFTAPTTLSYYNGDTSSITFSWTLSKSTTDQSGYINGTQVDGIDYSTRSYTASLSETSVFRIDALDTNSYVSESRTVTFYDRMWIGSVADFSVDMTLAELISESGLTIAKCKAGTTSITANNSTLIALVPTGYEVTSVVVSSMSEELIEDMTLIENFDTYSSTGVGYNLYYLTTSEPFDDTVTFTINTD